MPQNLSYTPMADGLIPRCDSKHPGGDRNYPTGGSDALRYYVVDAGHAGEIAIKTDGTYDFGLRENAASQLIVVGDRAWFNGVEQATVESGLLDGATINSDVTAFRVADGYIARGAKAGRGDFAYESRNDGQWIGSPYPVAASATPDVRTTAKMLFSYSMKHMGSLNAMRLSYFTGAVNPENFVVSNDTTFEYGEAFTGLKSDGSPFTGTIIAVNVSNSSIMFIPDGSYNSTDNHNGVTGATITGDVSGAIATMVQAGYTIPLANKPVRISTNNSAFPATPGVLGLDFITTSAAQFAHKIRGYPDVLEDDRPNATINQSGNEWENWIYTLDYSGVNFVTNTYRHAQSWGYTFPNTGGFDLTQIQNQPAVILFGYDWGGSTNPDLIKARVKNIVLDYDFAGVVIGDAPTLGACTILNNCGVRYSQLNQLYVISNYGDIPSGAPCYLYVRDNSGDFVTSTGVSIGVAP